MLRKITVENSVRYVSKDDNLHSERQESAIARLTKNPVQRARAARQGESKFWTETSFY